MTKERELALRGLMDIIEGGYNNIVLRRLFERYPDLSRSQKAFITELVNGAMRRLILLDYVIGKFSKTPVKKIKPVVLNILRLSVYQLLFMDSAPHAVVNEAVNMVKAKGYSSLRGYANGLLRNIWRNRECIEYPSFEKEPTMYLSVTHSFPEELVDYLSGFMSYSEIDSFCESSNMPPKVSLCVNTLKITRDILQERLVTEGFSTAEGYFFPECLYVSSTGDLRRSQSFNDGLFHVIDESAMAAAVALSPKPGDLVYDLCAAPGGKSFFMAIKMENRGKIIAGDIYPHKISLIEKGAARLGINIIETAENNALRHNDRMKNMADCVLVDAPCSGLGLIRKRPDIKYSKSVSDVEALALNQRRILDAAAEYPKIGGALVYSTCTLGPKENEENIKYFLENYQYVLESLPLPKELGGREGYANIRPHIHGTDGFFIARFIRKG